MRAEKLRMSDIEIRTFHPIAFDSPDHLVPLGTKYDNFTNSKFVEKCETYLRNNNITRGLILDLGCAGGGNVLSFVEKGHDAYGLEGSDYSLKIGRAAWSVIPNRLFTCDISRDFTIYRNKEIVLFDIIMSFEVMEHIPYDRLNMYFENIYKHMNSKTLFIGSFTTTRSKKYPHHHQTIMSKKSWLKHMDRLKLFKLVDLKWRSDEYLRFSSKKGNCIPVSFLRKNDEL